MSIIFGQAAVPGNSTAAVFRLPPGYSNVVMYQPTTAQSVFLSTTLPPSITRGGQSALTSSASVANNGSITATWTGTQPLPGSKILLYIQFPGTSGQLSVKDNGNTQTTFSLAAGTNAHSSGAWVFYGDNISPPSANYAVTVTQSSGGAVIMSVFGIAYANAAPGGPALSATGGATSASVTTGAIVPPAQPSLFFAGFTDSAGAETITLTNADFTSEKTLVNGTFKNLGVADAIEPGVSEAATWTASGAAAYDSVICAWVSPVPAFLPVPLTPMNTETYTGSAGATIYATTGNATASTFSYIISTTGLA